MTGREVAVCSTAPVCGVDVAATGPSCWAARVPRGVGASGRDSGAAVEAAAVVDELGGAADGSVAAGALGTGDDGAAAAGVCAGADAVATGSAGAVGSASAPDSTVTAGAADGVATAYGVGAGTAVDRSSPAVPVVEGDAVAV